MWFGAKDSILNQSSIYLKLSPPQSSQVAIWGHEAVSPLLVYLKLSLYSLQPPTTTPDVNPDA